VFDLAADPRALVNVIDSHQDAAALCRAAAARHLGIERLDALRSRYAPSIERLRALGYL
jgi:hypothetical protein